MAMAMPMEIFWENLGKFECVVGISRNQEIVNWLGVIIGLWFYREMIILYGGIMKCLEVKCPHFYNSPQKKVYVNIYMYMCVGAYMCSKDAKS